MAESQERMDCIAKLWAPIALEYAKFLFRHNLETICVISKRMFLGHEMQVFADVKKYNELRENIKFREEEKQIMSLLLEIQDLNDEVMSYNEAEEMA